VDDRWTEDLRPVLIGGEVICLGKVQELAGALGADYCEIDCLRDRNSGALHAVDVNTTPALFDLLAPETREALITIQARAFSEAYLSAPGG
jgi:hypothetical protein